MLPFVPKPLALAKLPAMLAGVFFLVVFASHLSEGNAMKRILYAAAVCCLLPVVCQGREWTDSTGERKVDASYDYATTTHVYLRLADNRPVRVRHDRLSEPDRLYVAQLQQPDQQLQPAQDEQLDATGQQNLDELNQVGEPGELREGQPDAGGYGEARGSDCGMRIQPELIRFVYRGHGTAQHLAGRNGTTVYYQGNQFYIAALRYFAQTASFYYYYVNEPNLTGTWWIFGKCYIPCKGYPVWRYYDHNGDGTREFVFWYYAHRYRGNQPTVGAGGRVATAPQPGRSLADEARGVLATAP